MQYWKYGSSRDSWSACHFWVQFWDDWGSADVWESNKPYNVERRHTAKSVSVCIHLVNEQCTWAVVPKGLQKHLLPFCKCSAALESLESSNLPRTLLFYDVQTISCSFPGWRVTQSWLLTLADVSVPGHNISKDELPSYQTQVYCLVHDITWKWRVSFP